MVLLAITAKKRFKNVDDIIVSSLVIEFLFYYTNLNIVFQISVNTYIFTSNNLVVPIIGTKYANKMKFLEHLHHCPYIEESFSGKILWAFNLACVVYV